MPPHGGTVKSAGPGGAGPRVGADSSAYWMEKKNAAFVNAPSLLKTLT